MGMPHPLRFGIKSSGQDTTTDALRAIWRIADQARFDHVWVFDHLASIGEGGPGRPVFEGWSLQAAIAVATEHVRLENKLQLAALNRDTEAIAILTLQVESAAEKRQSSREARWGREVKHSGAGTSGQGSFH